METLLNKIVLVVGGTGGIGAETCKLLHQSGAKVYVTGRNAETLNTICNSIGIPVKNRFVIDLKNTDSIHLMVEEIQSMTGAPIDILINAAGIGIIKSF
ncbi:MAG: SDR family NAD(P)-dependent oxidoreductase, partial [Saprospiraceae bacterium]|nr:SDR family NAD(P)-dependent oxidoreductase [Saprospiraceae bacterium]